MIRIRRKVVLHGQSTLTISLPSRWVKRNNIHKGEEIEVKEYENLLKVIHREESSEIKRIKTDFGNMSEEMVNSILVVLYKSGYDEIEITFTNPGIIDTIKKRIQTTLIGYEIIEQKPNMCLIESVAHDEEREFKKMLRRIFIVSIEMARSSLDFVKYKKIKVADVLALEQINNRFTTFCHRLINKKAYKDEKTSWMYNIVWLLESICDDYRDMILFFEQNNNIKMSKEVLVLFEKVNNLFENYYNLFYIYSIEGMEKIRKEHKKLKKEIEEILKFKTKKEVILGMYLFSVTQRIYDCFGSTTGLHY